MQGPLKLLRHSFSGALLQSQKEVGSKEDAFSKKEQKDSFMNTRNASGTRMITAEIIVLMIIPIEYYSFLFFLPSCRKYKSNDRTKRPHSTLLFLFLFNKKEMDWINAITPLA